MACVLLNQLMFSVYSSLKFNYKDLKLFCWTGSLDCLFWIHNTKKMWKQFVQTRVLKIRDTLEGTSWLFCPGMQNHGRISVSELPQEDCPSTKNSKIPNLMSHIV